MIPIPSCLQSVWLSHLNVRPTRAYMNKIRMAPPLLHFEPGKPWISGYFSLWKIFFAYKGFGHIMHSEFHLLYSMKIGNFTHRWTNTVKYEHGDQKNTYLYPSMRGAHFQQRCGIWCGHGLGFYISNFIVISLPWNKISHTVKQFFGQTVHPD